jgi:hypothetical protein
MELGLTGTIGFKCQNNIFTNLYIILISTKNIPVILVNNVIASGMSRDMASEAIASR